MVDKVNIPRSSTPSDNKNRNSQKHFEAPEKNRLDRNDSDEFGVMSDVSDHFDHLADFGNRNLADNGQKNRDGFYNSKEEYKWDIEMDLKLQKRQLTRQEVDETLKDELGPEQAREMYELSMV